MNLLAPHDVQNSAVEYHRRVGRKLAAGSSTFRLHDLRHYAVSRLIEQGANVLLVSKVAGHARPSVTLDVYAHLFTDGLREAADKFDPLHRDARVVGLPRS